jgi:hypothetical protein
MVAPAAAAATGVARPVLRLDCGCLRIQTDLRRWEGRVRRLKRQKRERARGFLLVVAVWRAGSEGESWI